MDRDKDGMVTWAEYRASETLANLIDDRPELIEMGKAINVIN